MQDNSSYLAEIFFMAAVYRKHHVFDAASTLLREVLQQENQSASSNHRSEALIKYNLAELYSDRGDHYWAQQLYKESAEQWNNLDPGNTLNMLWYFGALSQMQEATNSLIALKEIDDTNRRWAS